ncbi:GNAT family N-acetyltransferase [Vagococcus intermedius]|uniref:GNAT family N-acetyltransferase n=1 Tax=Vagococcus intermedius TaxID=2991418 RepID=A0AAF0I8I5_9ENTE|nr:GNAT family protein [Vagococcus intermedius]WEG73996.1 GNAT family N-acetyltransferase [Vagococcus intermedius]WEG76076.1 GNAT family N-acetyltransferase [Vagococcus intermedius]
MILETDRLILRPFELEDATALYHYAKNPKIGPAAGWSSHTSVAESQRVIQEELTGELIFAIVLKSQPDEVIGCIDLAIGKRSFMLDTEGEIGYWLGEEFWGRGLVPEAVRTVLRQGFGIIGLDYIWCAAFIDNKNSQRVQEKIGFKYIKTIENVEFKLIDAKKTERLTRLSRQEWHQLSKN